MKKKQKLSFFALCLVGILTLAGCGGNSTTGNTTNGTNGNGTNNTVNATNETTLQQEQLIVTPAGATPAEATQIGNGNTAFMFTVVDQNNDTAFYEVHTNKQTVGEALKELNLIDGDNGPYGLMVTTVNGQRVDYNKDGAYWAFYINDDYAPTGVDSTNIVGGNTYSLRIKK